MHHTMHHSFLTQCLIIQCISHVKHCVMNKLKCKALFTEKSENHKTIIWLHKPRKIVYV